MAKRFAMPRPMPGSRNESHFACELIGHRELPWVSAAAVFGTEMLQRSCRSSLFVVAEYHRRPRRRPWTPVVAGAIALTNFAPPGNAPPGQDFTRPRHLMPLTGAKSAHSPRHIHRVGRRLLNFPRPGCRARRISPVRSARIGVLQLCQEARRSRIAAAISAACVSKAKCPVSKKRTTALGISRLNASAPAGRKNGSFLPQAARKRGLEARKYSWKAG